jgi:tetratricopeptide (TPR) repeat protein
MIAWLSSACSLLNGDRDPTIASLGKRPVRLEDVPVETSHEQTTSAYREFLNTNDTSDSRPQAMRRLADINLEAEPVITGRQQGDVTQLHKQQASDSIKLYRDVLEHYPDRPDNDSVLYQLARAYEFTNEPAQSLSSLATLIHQYPNSPYVLESHFRRGEILFVQKDYRGAEKSYQAVVAGGDSSSFYRQSLYKMGWCLFKQGMFNETLDAFIALLDLELQDTGNRQTGSGEVRLEHLSRADQELVNDTLRAVSLSFSYEAGSSSVAEYFSQQGPRNYEDIIYDRLGLLYLEKERFTDAAGTYQMFVDNNPVHRQAPEFQMRVIETYKKGEFPSLVLGAKKSFVDRYQLQGEFWNWNSVEENQRTVDFLKLTMTDLSRHYHALAQKNRKPEDYQQAVHWYRIYLESFPKDPDAPKMNFLLAELLFESGDYHQATREYETTAYNHGEHNKAGEAAYAAVLAYSKHEQTLSGADKQSWHIQATENALRFAETFPGHPEALAVLTRTSEDLLANGDNVHAASVAQAVIDNRHATKSQQRIAWTVLAHARFDLDDFLQAESAYQEVLRRLPPDSKDKNNIIEKLAASIYKQGEMEQSAGDMDAAVEHYQRVRDVTPSASIVATAEYDAAAGLMSLQQWSQAATVLDRFRSNYPDDSRQSEVTRRLATAYLAEKQPLRAAAEFERIGRSHTDPEVRRQSLWQSAELYTQAQRPEQSTGIYHVYIEKFPQPVEDAVEARHRIAEHYLAVGDTGKHRQWLAAIIKADQQAGASRTSRTRYLAATAQFTLAETGYNKYRAASIGLPLKRSLATKKQLMESALLLYEQAASYDIAEVTTAVTFRTADIYMLLSTALMESERPPGLAGEALEQYDILLEEQAYPFEEQAITLHETNIARINTGLYDSWIEKSMQQLAQLVPAKYAKLERSASYVETIQ